jgi:hypothetical protein
VKIVSIADEFGFYAKGSKILIFTLFLSSATYPESVYSITKYPAICVVPES